jgi:Protein of unknown function (DUF3108)
MRTMSKYEATHTMGHCAASIFLTSSVLVFGLVLCHPLMAQTAAPTSHPAPNEVGVPKPAVLPAIGTWKYKSAAIDMLQKPNAVGTFSVTTKDDGIAWTVTTAMQFPEGPVTDVLTVEKGTLILQKESFDHFVHPDQRWKVVAIRLDFTGNKATGTSTNALGEVKQVSVDLSGPIFAGATIPMVSIGCLPLAVGYSTTVRDWDVERLKDSLWDVKVLGTERITVPAGTFDSFKVELTSRDGSGDRETAWIAKDSRMPVKVSAVYKLYGDVETEMIP